MMSGRAATARLSLDRGQKGLEEVIKEVRSGHYRRALVVLNDVQQRLKEARLDINDAINDKMKEF